MLRITQTIDVVFRKKESYFSGDFLKGLALALFFHLALFILFRITLPPNLDGIAPLSPIAVEIDLKGGEVESTPSCTMSPFPYEIEKRSSFFNIVDNPLLLEKSGYPLKKIEIHTPNFSEIEKIDYSPFFPYFEEETDDCRR